MKNALLILMLLFSVSCARTNAPFIDCVDNVDGTFSICKTTKNEKEIVFHILSKDSQKVVYERSLSNGGTAEWIESNLVKFEVLSGYNSDISVFYFNVDSGEVSTERSTSK
ncbi:MAG: hypothetical protein Tsb0034_25420 [Ekhidna sp.]